MGRSYMAFRIAIELRSNCRSEGVHSVLLGSASDEHVFRNPRMQPRQVFRQSCKDCLATAYWWQDRKAVALFQDRLEALHEHDIATVN